MNKQDHKNANWYRPPVSVIVAVHNDGATLQQCIDSVASQSLSNIELIIVDGGSTDGTVDLLISNSQKIDFWISEPDEGIYHAWNKALQHATGNWICFLGADDFLWSSDALLHMVRILETLPDETLMAYGQVMLVGQNDIPLYPIGAPSSQKVRLPFDVMGLPPHPGLMHRREIFEKRGGFDKTFQIAGDSELLMRELQLAPARFVPDVIMVGMRQGGVSTAPANVFKSLRELRRIQLKYGARWPGIALILATFRATLRLLLCRLVGDRITRLVLDIGRKLQGKPLYWTRT